MTSMVFHGHRTHYAFSIRDNTATILYANQGGDYRNFNKTIQYSDIILRMEDNGLDIDLVVKNRYEPETNSQFYTHRFTEKELTVMRMGVIPNSIKTIVDNYLRSVSIST